MTKLEQLNCINKSKTSSGLLLRAAACISSYLLTNRPSLLSLTHKPNLNIPVFHNCLHLGPLTLDPGPWTALTPESLASPWTAWILDSRATPLTLDPWQPVFTLEIWTAWTLDSLARSWTAWTLESLASPWTAWTLVSLASPYTAWTLHSLASTLTLDRLVILDYIYKENASYKKPQNQDF